ncbi:uncharacterized protein LOC119391865 [Rhipicephalus sanguineus]|uniref:uncharacterized protein LOC119391865 n=1 Tax=Rhipicephalus sanguineus TaxID=34632 RepID=UPI001895A894|nr:uncharacterized protein LOC119391865 [Rhipicephalus sanguineus]
MECNVPEVSTGLLPNTDSTESMLPSMGHYAVRLRQFWPEHPDIWFAQVEARFQVSNVTSQQAKYGHLHGALPHNLALELCDILSAPLSQTPYDTLKKAILERTAISERRRLQMLLSPTELGDRRPSQLLRQMQALLGVRASSFDDVLLRELFIQRLPPMVQMVLTTASELNLSSLAALADKVYEIAPSQLPVPDTSSESRTSTTLAATLPASQSSTPNPSSSRQDDITDPRADIQRLTDLIASNLTTTADDASVRHFRHEQRFSRSRPNSPARFRRPSPASHSSESPPPCWYHRRFGESARRCTRPCGWTGNGIGNH